VSVHILIGDCRETMRQLDDASVDSVVCDPPYHLTSIVKRFGADNAAPAKVGKTGAYARASKGFMGQTWDGGDVAFQAETWAEVLRVLKPGGHLVAFSGTRTYHRMAVAIEDAGFEIRDQLAWVYGSGFPKSHNQPGGWGTALKPAWEPICLARRPLIGTVAANIAEHGTGAINIDGCRIETDDELVAGTSSIPCRHDPSVPRGRSGEASADRRYSEYGSTNFAATPGPRGGDPLGRWPANIIHDGSDEVVTHFPTEAGGSARATGPTRTGGSVSGSMAGAFNGTDLDAPFYGDSGSAARFFYCAKTTTEERGEGNNHPTVKPQALMRWLCRLVTPVGGTVLDPFMGSGSTGLAADAEQFNFIGCELSPAYAAIAEQRMRDGAGMFADIQVAA
jgi:site-specific DNA-methyltransferase (adenine-specific)